MKSINIEVTTDHVLEVRPDLTEDQAYRVLLIVKNDLDKNLCVNYDALQGTADCYFPTEEDEE
jgi:hypothetical protein